MSWGFYGDDDKKQFAESKAAELASAIRMMIIEQGEKYDAQQHLFALAMNIAFSLVDNIRPESITQTQRLIANNIESITQKLLDSKQLMDRLNGNRAPAPE